MGKKLFPILVILNIFAAAAWADPISFTFVGTRSGSLNGVGFSDAQMTFSLDFDTGQIIGNCAVSCGTGDFPNLATFSIPGFASGTITEVAGVNICGSVCSGFPAFQTVQFVADTSFAAVVANPSLIGYDLRSSIGPLVSTEAFSEDGQIATTAGLLVFPTQNTVWTFTATTVPEPASFDLITLGMLLILIKKVVIQTRVKRWLF